MDHMSYENIIPHPAAFVLHKLHKKYGLYDTKYRMAADYDFFLKLYMHKVIFFHCEDILATFCGGGASSRYYKETCEEAKEIALSYLSEQTDKKSYINKMIHTRYYNAIVRSVCNCDPMRIIAKLKEFMPPSSKLVIWGAGRLGNRLWRVISKSDIKVDFFVDNDKDKVGDVIGRIPIRDISCLREYEGTVLIAVTYHEEDILKHMERIDDRINVVTMSELGKALL